MNNPRLTRRDFLKAAGIGAASMLVGGGAASAAKIAGSKGRKPNIVFILADDMGIDSVSTLNSKCGIETPYINKLITDGMTFTDAHSGSAVCSPTRYGVLTGRYSWRTRLKQGIINKWERPLIDKDRITVGSMLQARGYHTACIGKWHLGWNWLDAEGRPTEALEKIDFTKPVKGGPIERGFDYYFGDDVPNWPPYVWIENDRLQGVPTDKMVKDPSNGVSSGLAMPGWQFEDVLPTITQKCVDYVGQRAKEERPFFLYFAMTSPHTPINPSKRFRGKSGISKYADFLMETDWSVGQVVDALEKNRVSDNTLVIFTADNGTSPKCKFAELEQKGVRIRENWRGHKADIWEGGHRVPFIAKWPGVIRAGSISSEVISLVDFMATAAEIVGFKLGDNAAEDSISLVGAFRKDRRRESVREAIVCQSSRGYLAVRKGKWKAEFCGGSGGWSDPARESEARELGLPPVQLYDVEGDPKEQNNLYAKHPEVVDELLAILKRYVHRGRSTPGAQQTNEKPKHWKQLPW
jgi:arylsulfatase A-like enzyme